MSFIPRPHEIYKHFKGDLYQVIAIAEHSETGEQLVVYQAMYGDFKTYARPLAMFVDQVNRERYPESAQAFRFELQGPDAGRQAAEWEADSAGAERTQRRDVRSETAAGRKELAGSAGTVQGGSASGEAGGETAADEEPGVRQEGERAAEEGELVLDPLLLEFLDSDSYEQKLNILAGLHHRITDEMLTTMAIACDIEINEGDTEERYEALRSCLLTLEHYECNRLR